MATRPERYIQNSIDALGRGGDGGPHRAPAPRAIKNVDLRLRAQGEGRVAEEGPYDALRSRGQSRFRETARDAAPVTRTAL